jgi:uncharacterized protein YhaN
MDGVTRIAELQAECDALRAALVEQQQQTDSYRNMALLRERESTALRARVEALEADRGRLQDALRHIVEWDDECGCEDHTSEDCCQLQGDADFCARCWAAVALKEG